jgi:transposase
MQVTTIGLDLAKNIFQVHGITKDDEVAFNRPLRRAQLLSFFSKLEPLLDWYGGLQQRASLGTRAD